MSWARYLAFEVMPIFPDVERALREPNGLLASGGELSPEFLLEAYHNGIFPWFNHDDPILWWSPDPRMVLIPSEVKISRSLAKTLRNTEYEVRFDSDFEQVMRYCAAPRDGHVGTWIHDEVVAAYCALHHTGFAHSVETWINGELMGGLYGVAIGRMFYGESMFSRATDTSKIALVHLAKQLQRWQFGMIDCQMKTSHLTSMGAREMSRRDFISQLRELTQLTPVDCWRFDTDLFP